MTETKIKRKKKGGHKQGDLAADCVVIEDSSHAIRILGEGKTPWTFEKRDKETLEEFLARKFGNWLPS